MTHFTERNHDSPAASRLFARKAALVRARLEEIVAFSAFAVSVVSMFIAYDESRATKRLVQASSVPYLTMSTTFNRGPDGHWQSVERSIENDGVGPADLRSAHISLDGRPVLDVGRLLRACCGIEAPQSNASLTDRMIRPGVQVGYLKVGSQGIRAGAVDQYAQLVRSGRIVVTVCYCSVFEDCWSLRSEGSGRPRPVRQCPAPSGFDI